MDWEKKSEFQSPSISSKKIRTSKFNCVKAIGDKRYET